MPEPGTTQAADENAPLATFDDAGKTRAAAQAARRAADLPPEVVAVVAALEAGDAGAAEMFLRQDKAAAQATLKALNDRKNHAAVIALTDAMPDAGKVQEFALIERAAAMARVRSPELAAAFLSANAARHKASAAYHLDAGRVLQDADAADLAIPFLATALSLKKTSAVVDRLFVCNFRLARNREALDAILLALDTGYRSALRKDFAAVIRRLAPGTIKPDVLDKLVARFAGDITVGPSLLLHLIAANRAADIEAIASNGAIDPRHWDEDLTLQTAAFLEQRKKPELALSVLCRCGGESEVFGARLAAALDRYKPEELKAAVMPLLAVPEGRYSTVVYGEPYLDIAERLMRQNDADGTLEALMSLRAALDPVMASVFYGRYRKRIEPMVAYVMACASGRADVLDRIAQFVTFWIDPAVKHIFASEELDNLIAVLAPPPAASGRRAMLRENYYRHHLERREDEKFPASPSDVELSWFALRYFRSMLRQVPADTVPVPPEFARLRTPSISFDASRRTDVLMSFASAAGVPATLAAGRDEFVWRYVGASVPENNIPSALLPGWVVADLNTAETRHGAPGITVTKFLRLAWQYSEAYKKKYDLAAAPDSLLLFLDLMATWLARYTQYRPFLAAMVPAEGTPEHDVFRRCLTALTGGAERATALLDALAARPRDDRIAVREAGPQSVLLIGFASKTTGLGRNFHMLRDALKTSAGQDIALATLDFDARQNDYVGRLDRWRRGAGARPIVVFAVNAEDVPLAFLKDVRGAFDTAHTVGFFLWEMSRTPEAQRLGIDLVDEVWAPSEYVASIYAPLKPTHVVGKGLYDGTTAAALTRRRKPFRFLTVFDFDSSIERKNPLAVALAFQKAFPGNPDVELVLKGSGIKPAHWSNRLKHWERLTAAIAGDRRIRLITSRLSDAEMDELQRGASAVVSLHRSEGFGYVTADAMAAGIPVIATAYSGNADYCTAETSFPVDYRLIPVDPLAQMWNSPGAEWADADIGSAAAQMRAVYDNYDRALQIALNGRQSVVAKYDKAAFARGLLARIKAIRGETG